MALRHYRRQLSTTSLLITGLALGLASALVVFLIVRHETNYDQHHTKGKRVYRVETENTSEKHTNPGTFTELPNALQSDAPELETIVPIWREYGVALSVPQTGDIFKETAFFAEQGLFNLLDYSWLEGDARTALSRPFSVVLTRTYAQKFFGTEAAVGKTIRYANGQDLLVTGIVEDYPMTTNFPLNILVSFPTLKRVNPGYDQYGWQGFGDNFQVYVLLKEGIDVAQMASRLQAIATKYMRKEDSKNMRFVLNPLTNLHYGANLSDRQANVKLLNILSLTGLFVLLLACINFINLTTAQALHRAKEVGIRKAIGSSRRKLIYQFLTETGLITLTASGLSFLIAWLILPTVAATMALPLSVTELFSGSTLAFIALLFGLTTLVAGAYPALRLSGMPPIWALTTNKMPATGRVSIRQALVVFQFTVSLILISSTFLIKQQLSLFQNADMGFNKNAIITVGLPDNKPEKLAALRNQLMQTAQVQDVSFSLNSASAESNWMTGIEYRKGDKTTDIRTQMKMGDAHYLSTYGIQLLTGEHLKDSDTLTANQKVIANEVFLQRMGISRMEEAIGQQVYFGDGAAFATIIGVAKNFNVNSLHQNIDPTLIQVVPKHFYQASIKLQSGNLTAGLIKTAQTKIEKVWKNTFPNQLYEYSFLDDTLSRAYENETRTGQLIMAATFMAILIACLGLFGLATFSTQQRTKEIGVRKVLGASVISIMTLLSKDFLKLVLIAIVIASPIAWYGMSQWLQDFAYHINIEWWVFALAGLLAVGIALLTVSFQAIKAALMNPVKSLKTE